MKNGSSSLNPYAASYIPLSKRAGDDVNKDFRSEQGFNRYEVSATPFANQPKTNALLPGSQHQNVSQNNFTKPNDHSGREYFTSTSQYANEVPEKLNLDDDMDLAYLQMIFPDISSESLLGVYLTNKCDLDASIDMINQLEMQPVEESSDKLPDTLDIGDVPESGVITNAASTSGRISQ